MCLYPKESSDIATNSLFQARKNVDTTEVRINETMKIIVIFLYFFKGNKKRGDIKNNCMSTSKYHECPTH